MIWLIACTKMDPIAEPGHLLSVQNGRLYNQLDQQVLLRGFNARVEGVFDVDFDDGRTSLANIPGFTGDDCKFISQQMGLNLLRLPINWSGIEPEDDQYDQDYIESVFSLVDDCYEQGVYTIIDLHQDAYSKEIGEDGAPLWAIYPPPEELLEGPLEDLAERRTSTQVLAAFSSLYRNEQNLLDAYIEMTLKIANEMKSHPGAVALELQNEPVVLGQIDLLYDFYDQIMDPLRQLHPELPVVFEPDTLRNFTDQSSLQREFTWSQAIYGPHIYTDVFEDGWIEQDVDSLDLSVDLASEEADFHQAHLFVGEFGNAPQSNHGFNYIVESLVDFDRVSASWAFWLYEEYSSAAWGIYDQTDQSESRGPLREDIVDVLSRPFPQQLSGEISSIEWDNENNELTVQFVSRGTEKHLFSAPIQIWSNGPKVYCDEQRVPTSIPRVGRIEFNCTGTKIILRE
jgi:endoglycosylceramidase